MSGPPPAYDEHEKYATSQPEYMATFHSVPTPGSPRTTLRPPGHAIYDHSCSTHPPTHIRSQYECHGTPVYQYRNSKQDHYK
ncbi:unnamed protein product, partial [Mesorhabditis belari]|uniref:Uncharacterized protein n=1 Tax=Mesorhabditis belari TaxID=2138241 RepID=A0AAF3FG16_9BILA